MNSFVYKVLLFLSENNSVSQRLISEKTGVSLGMVNKCIQYLRDEGFILEDLTLCLKAKEILLASKPRNAIILAAGYGLRMVPINMNRSKAFLTVNGKPLIERLIEQLNEKGITDISIVVGYMKETFDYLIDSYGVKLIYNKEYSEKNNLHSLVCASNEISNTYILPCDIWCLDNPFNESEMFSWYMVKDQLDINSSVRINRQKNLECVKNNLEGSSMVGISYISNLDAPKLKENLLKLDKIKDYENLFWETALFYNGEITVNAKIVKEQSVKEINSYEDLRELDEQSNELNHEAISVICEVLNCNNSEIKNISALKKGMTNRSFIFTVKNSKYIMRIPGEGTSKLINRKEEAQVYESIKGKGICDELFYINPDNGMKISAFVENSRCCDAFNNDDLIKCMKKLKRFHELKLKVDHEFDIFRQIEFYESLWETTESIFRDYRKTKENVLSLKPYIEKYRGELSLTHIDAVADNFLFSKKDNEEVIQIIDWEYSGMQDPHVDIAMFCIYSLYDKNEADHLMDIYFEGQCTKVNRTKIYAYIAACGLLWSNWCEYKRQLGVEFGEYSLRQYRYAKDFYVLAIKELQELEGK